MARKPIAKEKSARPARAREPDITIRWTGSNQPLERSVGASSRQFARQVPWWNYALLNRDRWRGTDWLAAEQQSRALNLWRLLFEDGNGSASAGAVPPLADFDVAAPPDAIEVSVRSEREADNWAYRVTPWEFVLSSVIRAYKAAELREQLRVPVIRRWVREQSRPAPKLPADFRKWRVLIVLSAPGFVADCFDLKSEQELVCRCLVPESEPVDGPRPDIKNRLATLWTPTLAELSDKIAAFKPDVIHFAGCDTHQVHAIAEAAQGSDAEIESIWRQLGLVDDEGRELEQGPELDGYALLHPASHGIRHGPQTRLECVPHTELAKLFVDHRPALVCWNMFHSGNRVAATCVGGPDRTSEAGAGASIGFQDYVDDGVAEEYFDEFYRGLRATRGNVGVAHVRGLRALWRLPGRMGGAGIVCWTRDSLLGSIASSPAARKAMEPTALTLLESAKEVDASAFNVDIEVPDGLNYAQLHMKQYPFTRFRLYLDKPNALDQLSVEVLLNGEDRELAYRSFTEVNAPFADLREKIELPLTAPLARSCRESVATTLSVRIKRGEQVLHCDTYPTRLLPADQWRFEEGSAHTLASFVFPRDPEVERLVLSAQKYVRVLRDDALAGFEGYQATDTDQVDLQVRALWSALLHEYRLGYINPPPAYSKESDSQRLRTPSMVLKGGWGTCVDLALLLAAVLELIDVYPVIFVLKGHAFAGYWRTPHARERFLKVEGDFDRREASEWHFNPRRPANANFLSKGLPEIRRYTDNGDLVPLEATLLTTMGGFESAISDGHANLQDEAEFDYMIDLLSARAAQITPLPLNT